ncbi:methylated-DNA--[protein]-cysteine S-methyltransferase [Clostridium sp. B9]|uniref:methylated-DNA--[protein]-cysteine S-methyltransferase n=1 Tax=Clostridium sp. B9 TaxID=3423224 RepID=UPI003D2F4697
MNIGYYNSPIGIIEISEINKEIVGIKFVEDINLSEEKENECILNCKKELSEYFQGERKEFSIKINFIKGTDFQKSVWNALKEIKYGEKVSYKDIAEKIGNPKAVRAVGGANNKNPIGIIVPCHRVIGKNGNLVGYAGGLNAKEFLLNLENKNS